MLGAIWRWMLKFVESFGHVIWHRQIGSAIFVLLVQLDAQVEFSGPIFGGFVIFARVLFADVFNSEIVDHQ
jgi:hypothetical protein